MATLNIKLSQNVVDKNHQLSGTDADTSTAIADVVTEMIALHDFLGDTFYYADRFKTTANQAIFSWYGGASVTLTGQIYPIENWSNYGYGTAISSSRVLNVPKALKETINGTLNYFYEYDTTEILVTPTSGTVNAYKLETLIADPDLGLLSMGFTGALGYDANENLSGSMNKIFLTAQKHVKSVEYTGNFNVSGNISDIGSGADASLSGTLHGYNEKYVDGSYIALATSQAVNNNTSIDLNYLADTSNWTGNDTFNIELPALLPEVWNINTGDGEDRLTLKGGGGNLRVNAGAGNDYVVLLDDAPVVDGGDGLDTLEIMISGGLGTNFENLVLGGKGNINGTGNAFDNTLTGNGGKNTLDGGAGADSMAGGAGDDIYIVDDLLDTVTEEFNKGKDTVRAAVHYTLGNNIENLVLTGNDNLNGTGNALKNILTGNDGDNRLDGGADADTMTGGAGDDVYVVDSTKDKVVELAGGGHDRIETALNIFTLAKMAEIEDLTFTGAGNATLTGNAKANTLNGGTGNDKLDGGIGADTLAGGAGDDSYYIDSALDVIDELDGEGTDTAFSSVSYALADYIEALVLSGKNNIDGTGNNQANTLTGNTGINTLSGLDGDDVLDGLGGNDILTGGAGNDTFRFSVAPNAKTNLDTITDFATGEDTLAFAQKTLKWKGGLGELLVENFGESADGIATTVDQRIVYNTTTGGIFYDADGSGRGKAVLLGTLSGAPDLNHDDIVIY